MKYDFFNLMEKADASRGSASQGAPGQRVLLLDAVAMGISRQYLFDNFGLTAARAVAGARN
jgi:hypothetical protein